MCSKAWNLQRKQGPILGHNCEDAKRIFVEELLNYMGCSNQHEKLVSKVLNEGTKLCAFKDIDLCMFVSFKSNEEGQPSELIIKIDEDDRNMLWESITKEQNQNLVTIGDEAKLSIKYSKSEYHVQLINEIVGILCKNLLVKKTWQNYLVDTIKGKIKSPNAMNERHEE